MKNPTRAWTWIVAVSILLIPVAAWAQAPRPAKAPAVVSYTDKSLDSALCDAAQHGTPAAIKALVKQGAQVDTICSSWQATPFENAVRDDNIANMTALLDAGADIDAWAGGDACCRETALGFAQSVLTVRFLLDRHANANIRRASDGSTPLIWLSMSATMADTDRSADGDTKIAQLLIDAGADVNVKDNDGMTPLIQGAGAHSKSFVKLLLDHGADVNARNSNGNSALDVTTNLKDSPLTSADDSQALSDLETFLRAHGAVQR